MRWRSLGLAVATAVTVGLSLSGPAVAAPGPAVVRTQVAPGVFRVTGVSPDLSFPCDDGYACFYEDYNGKGGMLETTYDNNFTAVPYFNDMMSSWINNTGTWFCWWPDIYGTGTEHRMLPDHNHLVNVSAADNDTASAAGYC